MNCRICKNNAEPINQFGRMPIANNFLKKEDFNKEYFFDLATAFCVSCKTFQLVEQPEPERMFHENYTFFSGSSKKMAEHFKLMAEYFEENFLKNKEEAFVVELGSNDGIMLQYFVQKGIKHLGVEPSSNVAQVAREKGVNTISRFFNEETAELVLKQYGQADVISAANVMCHIPDLASVARGVSLLLKSSGVFVFEEPYLGSMIQKNAYDQIYDEHVYIFSATSVQNIFKPYGLQLFRVEPQITHGGSMRYYLCFGEERKIEDSVKNTLKQEISLGLSDLGIYKKFELLCERNKADLFALLQDLKKAGKRVVGYAATSKSTTVLNYAGIGSDLIEYISDTTPLKQGKFTPGTHIPVKPYQDFKTDRPDYAILFAWNHAQEIFEKEEQFVQQGGKWITFIPEVTILDNNKG